MKKLSLKQWVISGLIAIGVILGALWTVSYFWWQPQTFMEREFPEWRQQNALLFHAGTVVGGKPGVLNFTDVKLGALGHPLLTGTVASLDYEYPLYQFGGGRGQWISWRLLGSDLIWTRHGSGAAQQMPEINGYPLTAFLEGICKLPVSPNGSFIPLKTQGHIRNVESATASGNQDDLAYNMLFSERLNPANPAEKLYRWDVHYESGAEFAGSLSGVLNVTAGSLELNWDGDMSSRVFGQLAQAAGIPQSADAWGADTVFRGKGSMLLHYPELQSREFNFEGEAYAKELHYASFALVSEQPLQFTLSVLPEKSELKLPLLELTAPEPWRAEDLVLTLLPESRKVNFSGKVSMERVLARHLAERYGLTLTREYPVARTVMGSFDLGNGAWSFHTEALEENNRNLNFIQDRFSLSGVVEAFDWNGHGVLGKGEMNTFLSMKNINFSNANEAFRSAGGSFKGMWSLVPDEEKNTVPQVRLGELEYALSDLVWESTARRWDFARTEGILELTPGKKGKFAELYGRGQTLALAMQGGLLNFSGGKANYEFTLLPGEKDSGALEVKDFYLQLADRLTVELPGSFAKWELEQPVLRGEARLNAKRQCEFARIIGNTSLWKGSCWDASWNVTNPEFELLYRADKALPDGHHEWSDTFGTLKFQTAEWTRDQRRCYAEEGSLKLDGRCRTETEGEFQLLKGAVSAPLIQYTSPDYAMRIRRGNVAAEVAGEASANDGSFRNLSYVLEGEQIHGEQFGSGDLRNLSLQGELGWRESVGRGDLVRMKCQFAWEQLAWQIRSLAFGSGATRGKFQMQNLQQLVWQAEVQGMDGSCTGNLFSLLLRQMDCSMSYQPDQGMTGEIFLENGNAVSQTGNLELENISLALPVVYRESERTAAEAEGEFGGHLRIGNVKLDQKNVGRLDLDVTQNNLQMQFAGSLDSLYFCSDAAALDGKIDVTQGRTASWFMNFNLPPSEIKEPLDLSVIYPFLQNIDVKMNGKAGIFGKLSGDFTSVQAAGNVELQDAGLQIGDVQFEGVTGKWEFPDLKRLVSQADCAGSFRSFRFGKWLLNSGVMNFALTGDGGALVHQLEAEFCGGYLHNTAPIRVEGNRYQARELAFEVKDLPMANFLALLGVTQIESNLLGNGKLNLLVADGAVNFAASNVHCNGNEQSFLRMSDLDRFTVRIKDPSYLDFALAVLRSMRCNVADFEFSDSAEALRLRIKADGSPETEVPFEYQGSGAVPLFRATAPGEPGFKGEVELNVELRLPR